MDKTDAKLFSKLKSGDAKAVQEWFEAYHDRLLKFVTVKVSSEKDAEEIVQDTFMSCLRHLPLFRGNSSIWTWMCTIARHEVADYFRKKYAKKAIHALALDEMLLSVPIDDAHHISEKVKVALAKLKKEYRELLLLKYVDKKKVKEIAQELGRSVKAVESDLFRARIAFREVYAQLET